MKKKSWLYLLLDVGIVTCVFFIFIWIKPASKRIYLPQYFEPFLIFLALWVAVSVVIDKYRLHRKERLQDFLFPVLAGNTIILAAMLSLMFALQYFHYSRLIVFGTYTFSFLAEVILASAFYYNRKLNRNAESYEIFLENNRKTRRELLKNNDLTSFVKDAPPEPDNAIDKELFKLESSEKAYDFIRDQVKLYKSQTLVISTSTRFNIEALTDDHYQTIVNLRKINDIKRLNKFFETINRKLPQGGHFVCSVVPNWIRKQHILNKFPPFLNYIYYFFYYIFKRVFPKVPVLKKFYFFITNGYNRAFSEAEAFGRLYSCGFEVLNYQRVNGSVFIISQKFREPFYDLHPTYGPLVKLKRVGKNGKSIYVYKLRTMHPFAEYLQDFVYQKNSLQEGGKFNNDFRISSFGKVTRKMWIDELPMLLNFFKGDLKLVGVRPLSQHYFELYEENIRMKRIKSRPGLIPPYYADMPKTLKEIQISEERYLDAYNENPFLTDWHYFWKSLYNILFKKARSR